MQINFVLVEPKVPENIGASARAIKTMGFKSLKLVKPCQFLEGKAIWVAHGSEDILKSASVYDSLQQALTDSDLSIATSAKQRSVKHDYVEVSGLLEFIASKGDTIKNINIVFGREESGLTNEEMALCDITSTLPMASPFPSLNLSQAVMLYAYELSAAVLEKNYSEEIPVNSNSFLQLKARVEKLLPLLGITPEDNRYGRIMERISFLGKDDINLLHSVTSILSEVLKKEL